MFELDRMPKADELGFFVHPDVPEGESAGEVSAALAPLGWEACFDEAGEDIFLETDCEYDAEKLRAWKPQHAGGDGWLLVAVYDTEDGPWAMFARPTKAVTP